MKNDLLIYCPCRWYNDPVPGEECAEGGYYREGADQGPAKRVGCVVEDEEVIGVGRIGTNILCFADNYYIIHIPRCA